MKRVLIALAVLGSLTSAASATTAPKTVKGVHHHYHAKRVHAVTAPKHAKVKLVRGHSHVHHLVRQAKADGVITKHERHRIKVAQLRQSKHVHHAKHKPA